MFDHYKICALRPWNVFWYLHKPQNKELLFPSSALINQCL